MTSSRLCGFACVIVLLIGYLGCIRAMLDSSNLFSCRIGGIECVRLLLLSQEGLSKVSGEVIVYYAHSARVYHNMPMFEVTELRLQHFKILHCHEKL